MVNKHFIFLFTFIFITGSALAQANLLEEVPAFQYNKEFTLNRGCFNNGFLCDSSFDCNVSLIYPDGRIMINNQLMDDNTAFRSITVNQSANNQLGFVKAIQVCGNGSASGRETYTVAITGDGKPFEKFPQSFFIIIVAFVFIATGMMKERFRMFKHLGSMLMMVVGILTIFPGYSFINYSNLYGISLGSILIGLGFYFLIEDSFSRSKQQERFSQPRGGDND